MSLPIYGAILHDTGFVDVELIDIHDEYRQMAYGEYDRLQHEMEDAVLALLGKEWHDHFVENWRALVVVLDSGDLRPGRLRALKR